jgi:acyl carrier protein
VIFLKEIPKGPTGKVQRVGLAAKLGIAENESAREGRAPFVAPRNPIEETIAALWRQVLRIERVGVNDRFLDLGGDSLLATMLLSRVRQALRLEVSLTEFFEAPTVAAQAVLVQSLLLADLDSESGEPPQVAGE